MARIPILLQLNKVARIFSVRDLPRPKSKNERVVPVSRVSLSLPPPPIPPISQSNTYSSDRSGQRTEIHSSNLRRARNQQFLLLLHRPHALLRAKQPAQCMHIDIYPAQVWIPRVRAEESNPAPSQNNEASRSTISHEV